MKTNQTKEFYLDSNKFLERVEIVKDMYYREFGLKSILVDRDACIVREDSESWYCKDYYCQNRENCLKDHRIVIKESLQWGGNFFYCCHKGFILWSVPIFIEGEFHGGLIAGFCLFEQDKDINREREYRNLFNTAEKIKYINPANLNYTINFFSLLAGKYGVSDINYLLTLHKKYYVQKEISEKVTDKKNRKNLYENLFSDKLNKFLSSFKTADADEIKTNLNNVMSEIYHESINDIDILKFRMLELFVLISRVLVEQGDRPEKYYEMTKEYIKKSEELSDVFSFSLWITELIDGIMKNILEKKINFNRIKMENAIAYAVKNIDKNITTANAAAFIGFSESKFSHLFTEEFGIPFTKYIMNVRMEEAKKILNTTSDSITIVASSLGFYDQSHFSRIFKQFTGFTPKEYQKKQR